MDFPLPPMGEGLFEVELVRWLVQPGDTVTRGQALAEVMSDKANMEFPAPFAGTITKVHGEPGTKLKVGEVVLSYDPLPGEAHKPGETVQPEAAAPVKAQPSQADGQLAATVAASATATAAPPAPPPPPPAPGPKKPDATPEKLPVAAPSVRHLARRLGIDLTKIRGSGPAGRILLDDLTPQLRSRAGGTPSAMPRGPDPHPLDFGTAGSSVKLVGLRRKIAEKMVASVQSIPHYSYIDECDLTDLVNLRSQLREPFAAAGVKLTYLAFFVKAVTRALKDVPIVNSTYDEASEEVTLHDHYHIGIAVAAPNGLIVPVIKDADRRDLAGIATEIERLSMEARAGKSRLEDLRGGTFTVTSVGNIGGLISTPIIHKPEVGIMGVGKVVKRPIYDHQGNIKPAEMIYLSFSFDHRIVDGAVGAMFGNAVLRYLTAPAMLLISPPSA